MAYDHSQAAIGGGVMTRAPNPQKRYICDEMAQYVCQASNYEQTNEHAFNEQTKPNLRGTD